MQNADHFKIVLSYPFYSLVRGLFIDYPGHTVAWYTKTVREQFLRHTDYAAKITEEDIYRIRVLVLQSKPTDLAGKITLRILLGERVDVPDYPNEEPDTVTALVSIALTLRRRLVDTRNRLKGISATLDSLKLPTVTTGAYMGYREQFSKQSGIGKALRALYKTFISDGVLIRHPPEVTYDDEGKDILSLRYKLVRHDHQGCWILPHVVINGGLYGLTASNQPILMREYKQ